MKNGYYIKNPSKAKKNALERFATLVMQDLGLVSNKKLENLAVNQTENDSKVLQPIRSSTENVKINSQNSASKSLLAQSATPLIKQLISSESTKPQNSPENHVSQSQEKKPFQPHVMKPLDVLKLLQQLSSYVNVNGSKPIEAPVKPPADPEKPKAKKKQVKPKKCRTALNSKEQDDSNIIDLLGDPQTKKQSIYVTPPFQDGAPDLTNMNLPLTANTDSSMDLLKKLIVTNGI